MLNDYITKKNNIDFITNKIYNENKKALNYQISKLNIMHQQTSHLFYANKGQLYNCLIK